MTVAVTPAKVICPIKQLTLILTSLAVFLVRGTFQNDVLINSQATLYGQETSFFSPNIRFLID